MYDAHNLNAYSAYRKGGGDYFYGQIVSITGKLSYRPSRGVK